MNLKKFIEGYEISRIVGYIRKSRQDIEREKRTGEDTLTEQRELMERVLNSIELPYELESEIGSGESIEGRPVFKEVLKDIENLKYQAVAVKELSRLSRGNYTDAGNIINLITENRVVIITPYKVYDPRNPMDMKQIRFELFLAREEYEMIKERMVGARYIYASQGKWVAGKAPYGYSYDKKSQKLIVNDEEAKVVRMIYDMFLNGLNGNLMSYTAIATYLSKMGIKTARGKDSWSYIQVKQMLTNDLYKGVVKFRTHERNKKGKRIERPESEHIYVENAHEPIIDSEKWDKVQDKISKKVVIHYNPLDFSPNELASICTCGNCGRKLIRNAGKRYYEKQDGTKSEYVKEFLKCQKTGCMSVKYRDVEEAILDYLSFLQELDENTLNEHLSNNIKESEKDSNIEMHKQMSEQIEKKEKELKERLNFIYEKYEKGIYTDEMFLQRKSAIDEEMDKLKQARNDLGKVEEIKEDIPVKEIKLKIKKVDELYNKLDNKEDKNELLKEIFKEVKVTILEKGSGTRAARFKITPLLKYDILQKPL